MPTVIDATFTPADFDALAQRDLAGAICVVFDVLRATSTMLTALHHGAEAIIPVADIPEALALKQRRPDVLLAGERQGLRITRALTGSLDFDFGNSPREFTPDKVRGKTIVSTTTNGTRALRAGARARAVLAGALLNLQAVADVVTRMAPPQLILICSGTFEQAAYEDVLAAGALLEILADQFDPGNCCDAALMARRLYESARGHLWEALSESRNGRKLLSIPELRDDVAFCAQMNVMPFVAALDAKGVLRRMV
jgi:2-phosphosulfolactate phosphatase